TMQPCRGGHLDKLQCLALVDNASAQQQAGQIVDAIVVAQLPMRSEKQSCSVEVSGTGVLQGLQQGQSVLGAILIQVHFCRNDRPGFAQTNVVASSRLSDFQCAVALG